MTKPFGQTAISPLAQADFDNVASAARDAGHTPVQTLLAVCRHPALDPIRTRLASITAHFLPTACAST